MIYIIFNGGTYSDKRISFVEVPDHTPLNVMRELAQRAGMFGERGEILARAPSFEWYNGELRPLKDFISDAEDGIASCDTLTDEPARFSDQTAQWIRKMKLHLGVKL